MTIKTEILTLAAVLVMTAGMASAATVGFDEPKTPGGPSTGYVEDGLTLDYARIVSGKCNSDSGAPCLALNNNKQTAVTASAGGTFSLTSFWYQLLGRGNVNTLTVTTDLGGMLTFNSTIDGFNDGGDVVNLAGNPLFEGITSLIFSKTGGGNVRIDDLVATTNVSAVPLPAAGWLLLAGVGGLIAMRRKRKLA